jgi:hypothetical protein
MLLKEMFGEYDTGYETPEDDNSVPRLHDLRKTRLTLGQINRLRKIEDVRNFEKQQNIKNIQRQYSKPSEAGGGIM